MRVWAGMAPRVSPSGDIAVTDCLPGLLFPSYPPAPLFDWYSPWDISPPKNFLVFSEAKCVHPTYFSEWRQLPPMFFVFVSSLYCYEKSVFTS